MGGLLGARGARAQIAWAIAAVGVASITVWLVAPAGAQTPDAVAFTAVDTAEVPIATLPVRVDGAGTGEPQTFLLGQSGTTAVKVALAGTGLTFDSAEVTVPPTGQRVAVTVSAGAAAQTIETIPVRVTPAGGGSQFLFTALVTRESTLSLVSPAATGISESSWPVESYSGTIRLHASSTASENLHVLVHYDPLRVGNVSTPLVVRLNGAEVPTEGAIDLAPDAFAELTLTASLVQSGTYVSRVELRYGDPQTILSVPVSITRSNAALSVAVDKTGTERATRGTTGEVGLDVREIAGRAVVLSAFTLVEERFDDSGDAQDADGLRLTVMNGNDDVTAGMTLVPLAPVELVARIDGLELAGTYTGSVRFTDASGSVVDVPITIEVKAPVGWAIAAVALGVALAAFFAWLGGRLLTWAERRAKAAALAETVNTIVDRFPPPPPALDALRTTMTLRLREAANTASKFKPAPDAAKVISVTEKHLDLLALLVGAFHVLASKVPDPGENADIKAAIALLENKSEDDKAIGEATGKLRAIIEEARSLTFERAAERLGKEIDAVRSQLPTELATVVDGLLAEAAVAGLPALDRQAKLAQAEAAAAVALLDRTGTQAVASYPEVATAFTKARGGLAQGTPRTLDDVRTVQRAVVAALRKKLEDVIREVETNGSPAQKAKVPEMQAHVKASVELEASDPHAAFERLQKVADWHGEMLRQLGGRGLTTSFELLGITPPVVLAEGDLEPGTPWTPSAAGSIAGATALRVIIWVVVGLATIALGVYALWFNDANWGSGADTAVAVLWGLGISTSGVTGTAGVANVRKSFGLGASAA